MTVIYLASILLASIIANILAYFKIKSLKKQPTPTTDARDLLHDITKRGRAIIKIDVLDPESLFVIRRGN